MEDSFGTVMEFSIALAGFTAVAIALSREPGRLDPLDCFRALNLLTTALGAGFGASFVLIGSAFGATGPVLWQFASAGLVVVVAFVTAVPIYLSLRLTPSQRGETSPLIWTLGAGGNVVVVAAQVANMAGVFGPAGPGPIMASLIWLLLVSSLMFVRLLVIRPGPRS